MTSRRRPALGVWAYFAIASSLGAYFTFAAVQGSYGVFRRVEINAEAQTLRTDLAALELKVTRMENLALRLSDTYLDLDLLDEQARSVLGMLRSDEIVVR